MAQMKTRPRSMVAVLPATHQRLMAIAGKLQEKRQVRTSAEYVINVALDAYEATIEAPEDAEAVPAGMAP